MVLFVQQAIIFSLTLIPVAVTALALLGCFTEFIASYLEQDFANINYDYIIGKNHINILTSKVFTNYQALNIRISKGFINYKTLNI